MKCTCGNPKKSEPEHTDSRIAKGAALIPLPRCIDRSVVARINHAAGESYIVGEHPHQVVVEVDQDGADVGVQVRGLRFLVAEDYCIGGAEDPYEVDGEELAALLRREMRTADDPRDEDDLSGAPLGDLLGMCGPAGLEGNGRIVADVTRHGCHSSKIWITPIYA